MSGKGKASSLVLGRGCRVVIRKGLVNFCSERTIKLFRIGSVRICWECVRETELLLGKSRLAASRKG